MHSRSESFLNWRLCDGKWIGAIFVKADDDGGEIQGRLNRLALKTPLSGKSGTRKGAGGVAGSLTKPSPIWGRPLGHRCRRMSAAGSAASGCPEDAGRHARPIQRTTNSCLTPLPQNRQLICGNAVGGRVAG
jgi:hypothetical protein